MPSYNIEKFSGMYDELTVASAKNESLHQKVKDLLQDKRNIENAIVETRKNIGANDPLPENLEIKHTTVCKELERVQRLQKAASQHFSEIRFEVNKCEEFLRSKGLTLDCDTTYRAVS